MSKLAGADHGPFLLARPGLYVRETIGDEDVTCLHLVFRGNDLHSGNQPTEPPLTPEQRSEIDEMIRLTGHQNRVAFVNYPNITGVRRHSALSFSPPLGFGNQGSAAPHERTRRHFTDSDVSFLGTYRDRAQRIGVEHCLALHNLLARSGMSLSVDLDDVLKSICYVNEEGVCQNLTGFTRFHPVRDVEECQRWLGYYRWYQNVCNAFHICITKHEYRRNVPIARTDVSLAFFWQSPGVSGPCDVLEPIVIVERVLGLGGPDNQVGVER